MTSLDALFQNKHRRRLNGCNICGATVEAQLNVQVRKADARGAHITGKGSTTSRTWSLCGEHTVWAYQALTNTVDQETTRA